MPKLNPAERLELEEMEAIIRFRNSTKELDMSRMTINHGRTCPACGEGRLEARESTQQVEHAGVKGTIPLHYAVCDICGSEVAEAGEARVNKRAMIVFRKHAEGLLTGREMREARSALHLTQSQAAQLFGGGKVAFSRYENDDIAQSEVGL